MAEPHAFCVSCQDWPSASYPPPPSTARPSSRTPPSTVPNPSLPRLLSPTIFARNKHHVQDRAVISNLHPTTKSARRNQTNLEQGDLPQVHCFLCSLPRGSNQRHGTQRNAAFVTRYHVLGLTLFSFSWGANEDIIRGTSCSSRGGCSSSPKRKTTTLGRCRSLPTRESSRGTWAPHENSPPPYATPRALADRAAPEFSGMRTWPCKILGKDT